MTDSLERFLARNHARLRQAAQVLDPPVETCLETAEVTEVTEAMEATGPAAAHHPPTYKEQEDQERRARRVARYEEVLVWRAQGQSIRAIARLTGLNKRTVQRYIEADGFPAPQPRARRHTQLERFIPYLQERWDAGCHNAKRLWQDLRARGFTGGYTTVSELSARMAGDSGATRRLTSPRGRPAASGDHHLQRAPDAVAVAAPQR